MKYDFEHLTPQQLDRLVALFDNHRSMSDLPREERLDFIKDVLARPYRDLASDTVFKDVMMGNPDFLLMLINDVTSENFVSVRPLPNELEVHMSDDKKPRVDVICEAQDGTRVIVEVQKKNQPSFQRRLFFYASQLIVKQIRSGSSYAQLLPVRVIAIMDFKWNHRKSAVPDGKSIFHYAMEEVQTHEPYAPLVDIYQLEMPRIAEDGYAVHDSREEWLDFLKNIVNFATLPKRFERFSAIAEAAKTDRVKDIQSLLDYMDWTISEYEREELLKAGYEDGEIDGFEKGMEKGIAQEKASIAKNLLMSGIAANVISSATGLSLETIAAL